MGDDCNDDDDRSDDSPLMLLLLDCGEVGGFCGDFPSEQLRSEAAGESGLEISACDELGEWL